MRLLNQEIRVWPLLISILILSSLVYPIKYGMHLYALSICILTTITLLRGRINKHGLPFLLFTIWLLITSIIHFAVTYRCIILLLILFAFTPIISSPKLEELRAKIIEYIIKLTPILIVPNLICYIIGYNVYLEIKEGEVSELNFSGFFMHPMWLAASCGISNIVIAYNYIKKDGGRTKQFKYILINSSILLISLLLSVISGSRSALTASILAICLMYFLARVSKKVIIYIGLLLICSFPLLVDNSTRIQSKQGIDEENAYGSRTSVWSNQFTSIKESPIIGAGHASMIGSDGKVISGRMETGSGWLSILSQTGIIGTLLIMLCFPPIKKTVIAAQKNDFVLLVLTVFAYLCLHSLFEGYILTWGYYLCALFWICIGYLYTIAKKSNTNEELVGFQTTR